MNKKEIDMIKAWFPERTSDADEPAVCQDIRTHARVIAYDLVKHVDPGRCRDLTMRKLRDFVQDAVAAIKRQNT